MTCQKCNRQFVAEIHIACECGSDVEIFIDCPRAECNARYSGNLNTNLLVMEEQRRGIIFGVEIEGTEEETTDHD